MVDELIQKRNAVVIYEFLLLRVCVHIRKGKVSGLFELDEVTWSGGLGEGTVWTFEERSNSEISRSCLIHHRY